MSSMLRQLEQGLLANGRRSFASGAAGSAEAVINSEPSHFRWRDSLKYRVRKAFQADTEQAAQQSVYAGVLLERYPICLPDVPAWRHEYGRWQGDWNAWRYKRAKKGWLDCDQKSAEEHSKEANFKPEPLLTEADRANDQRSLRRCTQGYLYLMLQDRTTSTWHLPRTLVTSADASVKDAVQRHLAQLLGNSMDAFLIGNAPAAHVRGHDASTFYMLGVILDGTPKLARGSDASDFAWMTRSEMLAVYQADADHAALVRSYSIDGAGESSDGS